MVYKNEASKNIREGSSGTVSRVFSDSIRLRTANLKLISHNRSSCYGINYKPSGIGYYPRFLAHLLCLVFSFVCKEAYLSLRRQQQCTGCSQKEVWLWQKSY